MKILRLCIICVVLLGFCPDILAGDYPEYVNKFIQELSGEYSELPYDANYEHILDSSTYIWKKQVLLKGKEPFQNKYNQKIYPKLYISFYWFKDSESCRSSFEDWLECFGTACVPLKLGENISSTKTIPTYAILGDGAIAIIRTPCEHINDSYYRVKQVILDMMPKEIINIMDVGCGGPVLWGK